MSDFFLKTIEEGSSGNSHLLKIDDEYLLLDVGISRRKVLYNIDFKTDNLAGAVVTHRHIDHYLGVPDLKKLGINLFLPFEDKVKKEHDVRQFGNFIIDAFALTDYDGKHWVHTNANGGECANYAYVIRHKKYLDTFNLLYATDCQYIKWKFPNIHNVLLGVDYEMTMLDENNSPKRVHQLDGHMSIDTACEFIEVNKPDKNVIFTHLSATAADAELFKEKASRKCDAKIYVTKPKYFVHFDERSEEL